MTTIFPSAVIPVIIMGIVLEMGKIASVSFLHQHWKTAPLLIRGYLIIAVFILVLINSMGIFGYLSKAHIEQEVLNNNQVSQVEIVVEKISHENDTLKDIQTQIDQIDKSLQKLTEQGKAVTALSQTAAQKKARDGLISSKMSHQKVLEDLQTEKINDDANNNKLQAEFGPLKYIADYLYGDHPTSAQMENTVRWIISILVFVFDPLAIALLVSAQFSFSNRKKKLLTLPPTGNIMKIEEDFLKE